MIIGTPQNYLGTLESILKGQKLNAADILWISNGKERLSYDDFCSYARSKEFNKTVSYESILVVSEKWWIEINHVSNFKTGNAFEYNVVKVTPDNEAEYNLFRLRNGRRPILSKSKTAQFFYFSK